MSGALLLAGFDRANKGKQATRQAIDVNEANL